MKIDILKRPLPATLWLERLYFHAVDRYVAPFFLAGLAILVVTFTILGISGSSVGIYHGYLNEGSESDPALIFGWPNYYRSDEVRVATPWTVAQSRVDYARVNRLFGVTGQMFLFYDVPVKDFTILFKPQNWGFFFLPVENAMAFKWWFRAALFLLAAYLVLLRITKNRRLYSVLGALALFLSPYIHWYYSVTLLDILTYFFLMFECFIRLIRYQRTGELVCYSALLAFLTIAQILFFYPPTQISLGWFFLIGVLMCIWQERRSLNPVRMKALAAALAGIAVVIGVFLTLFVKEYWPALQAITHTIYPGNRINLHPGYSLLHVVVGAFYNLQLTNEGMVVPKLFGSSPNAASGFFLFGVFLIPVLVIDLIGSYWKTRKVDGVTLVLSLVFALYLLWETTGVHQTLAAVLLIKSIPATRVVMALGVINFILILWYLFRVRLPSSTLFYFLSLGLALLVFLYFVRFGFNLRVDHANFIYSPIKLIGIAGFAAFAFFCLLVQWRGLFILLLIAFSFVSVYKVNPLYKGLSELSSGLMYDAVQSIEAMDQQKHRWVFFEERLLENLLQANGANAINGVYYYPDFALWKVLDPEGQKVEVYNRYSHSIFSADDIDDAVIELTNTDGLKVTINPCDQKLVELDVKYQVYPYPVKYGCLREIRQVEYPLRSFFIYERLE